MEVKLIRGCRLYGKSHSKGAIVEVDKSLGGMLIQSNKAALFQRDEKTKPKAAEKDSSDTGKRAKPKKRSKKSAKK